MTIVVYSTLGITCNTQFSLKNRKAIWEGRHPLYRNVGDCLRHVLLMNGVLTVTNGVPVPHSFNNNSEKDGIRKISTLEHKGFSYHALRDLVQR